MEAALTTSDVRTFLFDTPDANFLLDASEFSDDYITLCMGFAISSYNSITPVSSFDNTLPGSFPYRALLLYGTIWHMFQGRAALAARNQLTYTDGGLQVPIEERFELYTNLATSFGGQFKAMAQQQKMQDNVDNGWSSVGGDESFFPQW